MNRKTTTPLWKNKKVIPIILQAAFLVVLILLAVFFISNASRGLQKIGIKLGFDFLNSTAGFSIDDRLIDYTPSDNFGRALLVGLFNTLKVGLVGIVISGILGLFIGIGRLSSNWLVKKITGGYVEIIRNTPLLIQIFILYFAVFLPFPHIERNINFKNIIFFSNRGTAIPWFTANQSSGIWLIFLLIGLAAAVVFWKVMLKKQVESGKSMHPMLWSLGAVLIAVIAAYAVTSSAPVQLSLPKINKLAFKGGYVLSSEFASILCGLFIYHSAFIAEIVRAGIMAVPKGQIEATKALGMKKGATMRLVILPQAFRVIIPSVTSQFLNLFKNSTLAIAVGYTDLFSIGNTIINQTGQSIQIMILMASIYLIVSLVISFLMNCFNNYYKLVER